MTDLFDDNEPHEVHAVTNEGERIDFTPKSQSTSIDYLRKAVAVNLGLAKKDSDTLAKLQEFSRNTFGGGPPSYA